MSRKAKTSLHVSRELRDELRARKRGGETYEQLLSRMLKDFDADR